MSTKLPTIYADINKPRAPREWPRFMTARVAADYSDTSPWTIRRHVRPCGKRGRSFVYAIEDVERWMRGESIEPEVTSAPPVIARRSRSPSTPSITKIRELGRSRPRESALTLVANAEDVAA